MSATVHLDRIAQVSAGTRSAKVQYPIGLRELEVLGSRMVSSSLLRLTLGGEDAAGFESHVPEEHIRFIFPDEHGELRLPERDGPLLRWPRPMPVSREYTVRRHDPVAGTIDVDVALHPGGLAAEWAARARTGERIHVAGPPGGFVLPFDHYTHFLFGGDITALPVISRYLERLPATALGWAFVEVADAGEEMRLAAPAGVSVRWVHRGGRPPGDGDALERAMRTAVGPGGEWLGERTFVWIAGEAGALKPLRRWVRDELRVAAADTRITGYWKRGVADFDDD